jgi:hypothetical protein
MNAHDERLLRQDFRAALESQGYHRPKQAEFTAYPLIDWKNDVVKVVGDVIFSAALFHQMNSSVLTVSAFKNPQEGKMIKFDTHLDAEREVLDYLQPERFAKIESELQGSIIKL